MKLDRSQRSLHLRWGIPAALLLLAGVGWYTLASVSYGGLLGGGSPAGLACGVAAAAIILFEMLLWPRKALRSWRLGPTKHWMSAHIWFGIACLPLAFAHCGFHGGGLLTWLLMILLCLTVFSGIYGLVMQNILPEKMLREVPAETIYSQIGHISQQNVEDATQMLLRALGPRKSDDAQRADVAAQHSPEMQLQALEPAVIGAVRDSGRITGREVRTILADTGRSDADMLWSAFDEAKPYLLHGESTGGALATPGGAEKWFDQLRARCGAESAPLIDALLALCDQRRQFDRQSRMHRWLHGWLPLHIGISVGLSVLLVAHIVIALRYW